ncbi:dipeptidase [Parahaliea aestuarii]|uniref:Twin-arginine translocation signal domain-containing protein n=1 Tax=Parahaliea aestuarii TaxID=1852021 RepID=A0A5C8ZNP4_9GAMM|nr:membrane dipeptidase [Parahaliea aestuarii]TXS89372.1 twin-arginine translocation signal domain-containing protein [Parahaliea aestuarii]
MTAGSQAAWNRRRFLKGIGTAAVAAPMINLGSFKVFAASDKRYSRRAVDLVTSTRVFDMLSAPYAYGPMVQALMSAEPKRKDGFAIPDEQMALVLESGVDVFNPAVGLGGDEVMAFIGRMNALVAERPGQIVRIDTLADMERLEKGRSVGIILGVQNSDHFREPDDVDVYYHLGQRVSQLTYNRQNLLGSGATDRVDGGVSSLGAAVVERMNELGMAVDVSHCGDQTTLDAFEVSSKPVLITHSNVRALAGGHVRCKSDEAIRAMARSGGVMGITAVRQFVSDKEPTTIEQYIDHIRYVADLVGVEHVGVGSDQDMHGYDDMPEDAQQALKSGYSASYAFRQKLDVDGYDHPRRIYDLAEGLIKRKFSDDDIRGVLGGNFARALGTIWKA